MSEPFTPVLIEAVRLLADGEWHDFDKEIRPQLERLIPPGRAIRKNEYQRRSSGGRGEPGPPERVRPRTDDQLITSGRRALIGDVVRPPNFEIRPTGRIRPGETREVRLVKIPARLANQDRLLIEPEVLLRKIRAAAPDGKPTPEVTRVLSLSRRPDLEAALLHEMRIWND